MTLFPSVQEKAQAEIDRVVGHDRLPTFEDQEDMPYLRAVVLETLRWSPSVPTGQFENGDRHSTQCDPTILQAWLIVP